MSNTVKRLALVNALAGLGLMAPALGQAAMPILAQAAIPDAGRLDRELQPPLEAPKPGVGIPLPGLSRIPVTPGGEKVQLQGVRFTVVHETGAATGREARVASRYPETDVLVFGHSHIPWDTVTPGGLRLLNPGSPTDRRRQPRCTMLTVTVHDGTLGDVELIAL